MHRCLDIVEVQQAIFLEVRDFPQGKATLARLGRTCRTFSNTALSVLWERLDSIIYLIRCLPRDLWKIDEGHKITFQRLISRSDWEIFFSYSSRVRSLTDGFDSTKSRLSLDSDVIPALYPPPDFGPLLPCLKTLDLCWQKSESTCICILQLLLTGSLVTLHLPSFCLRTPAILMQIASRCPSLKDLSIFWSAITPDTRRILSDTIMCLDSLQSLDCSGLNVAAIIHLSRLPSLVELRLVLDEDIELETPELGLMSQPAFTALKSLTLETTKLSILTSLLEVMRFEPRRVNFTAKATPSPESFRLFFIALANACDREQLIDISLYTRGQLRDDERKQVSLPTLQPLLAFPHVESFTFDAMCNIYFDDDMIKTVTNHWPKLIEFWLNPLSGWGIESHVTHRGLIALLHCPTLRTFALSVGFAGIDVPPDQIPESRPGNGFASHCRRAMFVTSSINHPATIAAFLSDICPELYATGPFRETAAAACIQKWEEVDGLLKAFLAVRRQCLNWGARGEN